MKKTARGAALAGEPDMDACVVCGLALHGAVDCPGCGQSQHLDAAKLDEARCAKHPETLANKSCARCGLFMCVACLDADSDPNKLTCRACREPLKNDLDEQLKAMSVRIGIVSIVQALLVPALAFATHQENLTVISIALGIFALGFGVLCAASRTLWVVAPVTAGTLGLLSLLSVGGSSLMLLGVPAAVLLAKWFFALGPIERERWRLELDR